MTIEDLNHFCKDTLVSNLGIEFTEISVECIKAKMPVDDKTKQPMGFLHGGATIALAETLASAGSVSLIQKDQTVFGAAVSAHHVKSAKSGYVFGEATNIHIGNTTHVWEVNILNEQNNLISKCVVTVSIKTMK